MTRRREPNRSRRSAVLLVLGLFIAALLVVVSTARGEDPPPPTYKGRTAEEWGTYAEGLEVQLREARSKLATRTRSGRRARSTLRRLRASLREQIRMDGTTGEVRALLCIHRFEGAWNDPGSPYFGGLQMDVDFQRAYGGTFYDRLGTANVWPPFVQVAVGLRAVLSGRGFGPWPVSRRRCGV